MGAWSIPARLHRHVELVTGIADFPPDHFRGTRAHGRVVTRAAWSLPRVPAVSRPRRTPSNTDAYVVPHSVRALYGIPDDASAAGAAQGVIEFQGINAYKEADMAAFFNQSGLPYQPVAHVVGPFRNRSSNTERCMWWWWRWRWGWQ